MQIADENRVEDKPIHAGAAPAGTITGRPPFGRYLIWLTLTAFVLYLLPFALVRVRSFEQWGGTLFGPAMDYGFSTAGQNADVVIFGDSSALYDVDPSQISKNIGLKVLNLPNTLGSLQVTDDMVLRMYLQNNRPPQLIVFYFMPWDLDYHTRTTTALFEGEEMLARHGDLFQVWDFVRSHPGLTMLFPFQLYSISPKQSLRAAFRGQDRASALRTTMGHMENQFTLQHLVAPCQIPPKFTAVSSLVSVRALVERYRSPQTKILIFLSPIPACGGAAAVSHRSYAEVPADPPHEMSPALFYDDTYYAHLVPAGVPEATRVLAESIRAHLFAHAYGPVFQFIGGLRAVMHLLS